MKIVEKRPQVLIIRMRHVMTVDATGLHILEELLATLKKQGTTLVLSAVSSQPHDAMRQSRFLERVGEENIVRDIYGALDRARTILELETDESHVQP